MMRLFVYLIVLVSFVLLQSCATDPKILAEKQKVKIVSTSMKEQPKWFKKLPKSKKFLYAKGTAVSGDMQISIDKATLLAKRSLAEKIDSTITFSEEYARMQILLKYPPGTLESEIPLEGEEPSR